METNTNRFKYVLSLLNNKIHPTPKGHEAEVELVKKILTTGQGYLTKRTKIKPYVRVIFFDDNAW